MTVTDTSERNVYKLNGYDEPREAWCWVLADASKVLEGDIFRVKLGGMGDPDVRDQHGNYIFIAQQNSRMCLGENGAINWDSKCRPATENEMRAKCDLPERMAGGEGVKEGMPEA